VNGDELARQVAQKTSQTKTTVNAVLDALFDTAKEGLASDGKVVFPGFGIFKLVKRSPRKGRNPQTGETVDIPAKNAVKFTPSRDLKETLKKC